MSNIYTLRPFESARDQARRAGVDPKDAITEVRNQQDLGRSGAEIARKYQRQAMRQPKGEGEYWLNRKRVTAAMSYADDEEPAA